MLSAVSLRATLPLCTSARAAPLLLSATRRGFASSVARLNELSTPSTSEPVAPGTEGRHISTYALLVLGIESKNAPENVPATVKNDAHDEFKGDWVLFHPVYSPEELHAVTVSRIPSWYQHRLFSLLDA